MIKKIGFVIVCLACFGSYAQDNGTASPYSFFGIGEFRSTATIENQMMGGIGIYTDSIHVNLQNPAAYADLGIRVGETFGLTTYTAGISFNSIDLKSATAEEGTAITNLDYLALAFALRENLGIGIGVMPYSSVGYNVESVLEQSDGATVTNTFSGTGGLNRVYGSIGWGVTDNLKIGVTANYNFGTLESQILQVVDGIQLATFDNRESRIGGYDVNYAVNYTPRFKDKYRLHTSLRVNTQGNLSARNTQTIGSVVSDGSSAALGLISEEAEVDLESLGLRETEVKIPTTTTLGLGIGRDNNWFVGGEYSFQDLGDYVNRFMQLNNLQYDEAKTFSFGGFYVPDYASFKYFQRITYRAGFRVQDTGMVVNNTQINNFGITFGVGLPLGRSLSNINLGFEFGKQGTTSADLIEEEYFKINIGLSLNDQWFRKAKIN